VNGEIVVIVNLIVELSGDPIFQFPIVVEMEGDLAKGTRAAIDEFVRLFPDLRLWDAGIDLKYAKHGKPAAAKEHFRP
jgi:hypothetical protein